MLNGFSFEQLMKVEQFQLYKLFRVDSFTQGWFKITNTKLGGFKILKFLQEFDNLGNIISSYYPKSIWII